LILNKSHKYLTFNHTISNASTELRRHKTDNGFQILPHANEPAKSGWFKCKNIALCLLLNYYCDQKVRAACAQSFAPWQQATIEITRRDHSTTACSRHLYTVLFFAHIPFVVNRAFSAMPTERLQHYTLYALTNCRYH